MNISAKHGKLDHVVVGHRFERMSSLAPCPQTAGDDEHLESLFMQELRHPGASCFARSSTVEINLSVLGQILDLCLEVIGLYANGSRNALRVHVIVPMAAHVGDQDAVVLV